MKRYLCILAALAVLLTGCGREPALPGTWEPDWTVVSPDLAVEPLEGFALKEANDALAVNGIYYATWATGEARAHVNEEEEAAEIYDAQIYVLTMEFRSEKAARQGVQDWTTRAESTYETGEVLSVTAGEQAYTLIPLLSAGQTNPYSQGAAAWLLRGDTAVWIEFLCAPHWDGDPAETLETFLRGFHYAE